jgi:hypothetical protein
MKSYLWVLLGVFLVGCSILRTKSEPIERFPLAITNPAPLQLKPVGFLVLTPDTTQQFFKKLGDKNQKEVGICLSGADYKHLSENMQSIKEYIILQKQIISAYKEYYEPKDK